MPIATPAIVGALVPNLLSVGLLGTDVPKLCSGIAIGLTKWVPTIKVGTMDTGTAGVGSNVPLPVIVPSPLLITNLTMAMGAQGLLGIFAPLFIAGLSNGLMVSFAQMLVKTTHPGVGVGAGIGKYTPPPAPPAMIAGFTSAGLIGPTSAREATAIGIALTQTFASLIVPVAIVGPPSLSPGAGVGTGNIV